MDLEGIYAVTEQVSSFVVYYGLADGLACSYFNLKRQRVS
jgi:hypothetical protein